MNVQQKILVFLFFPLTVLVLFADHVYQGHIYIRLFKFFIIFLLYFCSTMLKVNIREQFLMQKALKFSMLGDFYFVLRLLWIKDTEILAILGVLMFIASYILLAQALQHTKTFSFLHAIALIPVLSIYFSIFISCRYYFSDIFIFLGVVFFSIILCLMSWRASCTIFEGYYNLKSAILLASAGILILISDLCVGIAAFDPSCHSIFNPGLVNLIWAGYLSGWIMITLVIAESNPLKKDYFLHT